MQDLFIANYTKFLVGKSFSPGPSPKRLGHTPFCGVHLPTIKGKTVPRNAPGNPEKSQTLEVHHCFPVFSKAKEQQLFGMYNSSQKQN
jgi:hypothetical protein